MMVARSCEPLRLLLPADAGRLRSARREIRAFLADCGVDERSCWEIVLALQEALKNAIRFGGGQDVELQITVTAESVYAVVKDSGQGFARSLPHSFELRERPDVDAASGRGLFLISNLMDEVRLEDDDGAQIQMVKRLAAA